MTRPELILPATLSADAEVPKDRARTIASAKPGRALDDRGSGGTGRARALVVGWLLCGLTLCNVSGCKATFSEVVSRTSTQALSSALNEDHRERRIAAITYSEEGASATSQAICEVAWEFVDQGVIQTPRCTNVSPELVRRTLTSANIRPMDLHTRGDRDRLLTLLDEENQRPDLLLLAKLSRQNQKTRPGFRNPRILLSVEVVDCLSGDRLAKENAWLELELYQ